MKHPSIHRLARGLAAVCTLICLTLGLAARPAHAQAGYYTYTLNDATFNILSTGTVSGYFDYDPTTNTLGSFDIVTSPGNTSNGTTAGATYDNATATGEFSTNYGVVFGTGTDDVLSVSFNDPLPTSGTENIDDDAEGTGTVSSSGSSYSAIRDGNTGYVSITPAGSPAAVPELSPLTAIALLSVLGCGALGLARAKRRRSISA